MPLIRELQWDELDLLQGLDGVPTEGADGSWHYRVRRDGLLLLVALWPRHGLVDVTLQQQTTGAVLLDVRVAVRGRIRYNNDKRGEYLAFADCVLVQRVFCSDEDHDAAFSPNVRGRTLLVASQPHVSILFE
ncbi:hypothetical protein [Hymenobacter sp. B81]|uniref:hypothetical protein n=1 Tax=Hymenobacter sp. B81 TaxID=3344878 RepID=UPI0037DC978E